MWISGRAPLTEERFRDIREQSARMELLTVQTLQETVPGMEAVMFLTEAEMVPETEVTDLMFLMEVLTMEATMTEAMMMAPMTMVPMMTEVKNTKE